jgi:hypothetical protein
MNTLKSFDLLDDLLDRVCEKLQISPSQQKQAEERYAAVGKWLSDDKSILALIAPQIYPQGSLRIGTTVKPLRECEYDLDIVCELALDWRKCDPIKVLNAIEARLRESSIYLPLIQRKNRCIRLDYANEFHLDILPACPDSQKNNGCVKVPDRKDRDWKDSNPRGYAEWFEGRSRQFETMLKAAVEPLPPNEPVNNKPPLKRVVQLMKRFRDINFQNNPESAPISIILTTIAGSFYAGQSSINKSISYILRELMINIQTNQNRIVVLNPTNHDEDFSENWDNFPELYNKFIYWVGEFYELWERVNNTKGIDNISKILKEMFGEDVINVALKSQADFMEDLRNKNLLQVSPITGTLLTNPYQNGIQVMRNTFYGK